MHRNNYFITNLLLLLFFFYAQSSMQNNAMDGLCDEQSKLNKEIATLVDNVCILLLNGHSVERVIQILDDGKQHPYDLQQLVQSIDEMLNKQSSREAVYQTIIEQYKKFEKSYNQKKFWSNVKKIYFLVKIIVFIALILLIYFWGKRLFELINTIFNLILNFFKKDMISDQGSESKNLPPLFVPPIIEEQRQKSPDQIKQPQQELPDTSSPVVLSEDQAHVAVEKSSAKPPEVKEAQPKIASEPTFKDDTQSPQILFKPNVRQVSTIDVALLEALAQQSALAQKIGLKHELKHFAEAQFKDGAQGPYKKVSKRLEEQIEQAKILGMFP